MGVFNKLHLDHGAAKAGATLTDILLAARAVADLPPPLPDEVDPRPIGQKVASLFCPGQEDVCIDGEILAVADQLEFETLIELGEDAARFRDVWRDQGPVSGRAKHPGFTAAELRQMTKLSDETIRNYMEACGIPRVKRGGKNQRYPLDASVKLLGYVRDNAQDGENREAANRALEDIGKIPT